MIFKFREEVLRRPEYAAYRGHLFQVEHHHPDPDAAKDHVWVSCVDNPKLVVQGYVHTHDLELVKGSVV